jgi:hypothetical protein
MLTFLRKIRKSLINGSSGRRYLLYAIGEIALVVIGILIALQINNWNEWRKDREKEKTVLTSLYQEIATNIDLIDTFFHELEITKKYIIKLYGLFGAGREVLEREDLNYLIDKLFVRMEALQLNLSVYNETINSGKISLVTNDDSRLSISEWSTIIEAAERFQDLAIAFQTDQLFTFTIEFFPWKNTDYLYSFEWDSGETKLDYDLYNLFQNMKFENLVNNQLWHLNQFKEYYDQVRLHAELVLKLIAIELGEVE